MLLDPLLCYAGHRGAVMTITIIIIIIVTIIIIIIKLQTIIIIENNDDRLFEVLRRAREEDTENRDAEAGGCKWIDDDYYH